MTEKKHKYYCMILFSFRSTAEENENDMRFVYCACCISYMLQDWSGVDTAKIFHYISQSQVCHYVQ